MLREPCPRSSPRRLTPRIGRARRALSTPHLQIPLSELGDSPARPFPSRTILTRCRRKPAAGNTALRLGHAKLLWAVDPGQTRVQARRWGDSPGGNSPRPRAPSSQTAAQSRAREGGRAPQLLPERACACLSSLVFVEFFPGVRFFEVSFPSCVNQAVKQ